MDDRKRMMLCYLLALLGLIILTIVRFKMFEDPHGAMLLMLVDILAFLGIFLDTDYDMQCCKNCGIMAFIGGVLDVSIAVETFGKARHVDFSWTDTPSIWIFFLAHLAYAAAEIAWSLLCYFVCQRFEETWESTDEVYVATQEQAQVYGAVLHWTERRLHSSPTSGVKEFFSGSFSSCASCSVLLQGPRLKCHDSSQVCAASSPCSWRPGNVCDSAVLLQLLRGSACESEAKSCWNCWCCSRLSSVAACSCGWCVLG